MIGRSVRVSRTGTCAPPPTAARASRGCAGHDACSRGGAAASRPAEARRMRFEKWQALGNDYLIVEASDLSFPLTPGERTPTVRPPRRSRRRRSARAGARRRSRLRRAAADLQPGRVGGRAVGNGAREAILYLRRAGWTDRTVLDPDGGGRDPADDPRPDDVPGRHGPRGLHSRTSRGGPDGAGEVGRGGRLPARPDRQPAVRDPRRRPRRLARWTCPRSARRSSATRSSPTAPTSRSGARPARRDPGADLRARRGGDAVVGHRRVRRRRRVRAAGRRVAGHRACSTAASSRSTSTSRCTSTSPAGRCRSTAAS